MLAIDVIDRLLRPDVLALSIPIVAIVMCGVIVVSRMLIKHRERMALIEQGMHPDYPLDEQSPEWKNSHVEV